MKRSFRVSSTTTLSANRFVTSTNQANGTYTLANSGQPTTPSYATSTTSRAQPVWPTLASSTSMIYPNGRLVTAATTHQGGTSPNDTPGTLTVTGMNVMGRLATDVLTLVTDSTVTGVVPFVTVNAPVQAGWAIDTGGTPTADTIVVGHAAEVIPFLGDGVLESMIVLVTAAAALTIKDKDTGTLFATGNSFPVGFYQLNIPFFGYLSITHAGAYDVVYTFNDTPPDKMDRTRL